jgi:glutamate N-acetyltransferase / amino-acid N-acetyltransferase
MTDVDTAGSVTTPRGFRAGATYAGMKTFGDGKLDIAVLRSGEPCATAATFTRNRLHSASVDINREHLRDGRAQAVVVNAGIANSSTGERGLNDARRVTGWVASRFDVPQDDVLICSTGVIGHFLPMDKMENGVLAIELQDHGGVDFANAIMTTDSRPKHAAVQFGGYTIGGCVKGSGMIHPNMATMLAFLTTDAPVEQTFLRRCLADAVDQSFNLVSVDGDTSPSDTVLLMANGVGGGDAIGLGSELAGAFQEALDALCIYLAREIARDGEGATKLMEVSVTGAASTHDARHLVRLLTTSYLLKSAVHGADPNWGRIVSVIGRSGIELDESKVAVGICGQRVFEHEQPTEFDPEAVSAAMQDDEVTIDVDLGIGPGQARGWGCDLTAEYVSINADYHT